MTPTMEGFRLKKLIYGLSVWCNSRKGKDNMKDLSLYIDFYLKWICDISNIIKFIYLSYFLKYLFNCQT